jgi:Coenzyme PQQ synthesis protein D (PqqD)
MAPDTMPSTASLLTSSIKVPQHVVYRSFPSETVVLNLETGKYHGLNATADAMLEALENASCVRDAAAALGESYEQPREVIEQDVCELCQLLLKRGLIEVVPFSTLTGTPLALSFRSVVSRPAMVDGRTGH